MDSSIVITGAAGFIGSHLAVRLLRRGARVVGVDNFDSFYGRPAKLANVRRVQEAAPSPTQFRLVESDIREATGMRGLFEADRPDLVFHLAALAGVRPSIKDPARYVSVNLDGTTSVLEACRAAGCRNVVFASSSSVYGNNSKAPFAESDSVDEPISPYAATKRAGELVCRTYAHLFGLRIAALRFFTVYGPAQRPDLAISSFMRLIAAGEPVPMFGDGRTSRDYTYIDDIIDGVVAAAEYVAKPAPGPSAGTLESTGLFRVFNLGSDHPVKLADMIEAIANVVGKPARIERRPMQPGDVERTWADISRSRAELGYAPRMPFEEGLSRQWHHMANGSAAAGMPGGVTCLDSAGSQP